METLRLSQTTHQLIERAVEALECIGRGLERYDDRRAAPCVPRCFPLGPSAPAASSPSGPRKMPSGHQRDVTRGAGGSLLWWHLDQQEASCLSYRSGLQRLSDSHHTVYRLPISFSSNPL